MRDFMPNESVVVGQVDKSDTEIVRVIRKRYAGLELVHLPVFSIGGRKNTTSEKGISLTLEKWRQAIPLIQQALEIEFSKPSPVKPMKKADEPPVKPNRPAKRQDMAS